ncbi:aldo/keto reductase [Propionibacteriaceae bacterium Y1700]|uniref:aldo/keto reductase n=1 Tax=Microlunatus sp. Y1700 TaxID=3418487 RepID=UPI003DA77895
MTEPGTVQYPFSTSDFNEMPYRRMGRSGLQTSAIGLGTWKFGYPDSGDQSRTGEQDALAVLDRAHALGVTFWDTANRYNAGTGNSERILGKWFATNPDKRRDVVLATKLFGGMDGFTPNHSGLGRLNITESLSASMTRLQADWVDLLWFHGFDSSTPVEESLETVEDLVSRGVVHHLGVSNVTVEQLEQYLTVSDSLSRRTRPIAVQNRLDPIRGEKDPGVLDLCAAEGIAFVPYSPLAGGLLTDRYLDPAKVGQGDRLYDEGTDIDQDQLAVVAEVGALAEQWGHTISQVSLAWLLTLDGMGSQIPTSSTIEQLEGNAAAGRIELSEEQAAALTAIFGR